MSIRKMAMRCWRVGLVMAGTALVAPSGYADEAAPLNAKDAKAIFAEVRALCEADHGQLWGVSLCGPVLLVDPVTRDALASEADMAGALRERDGVFAGTLPKDVLIANTTLSWSGVQWIQYLWPLPNDELQRRVLLVHESFHRIQDQLGLPAANPDNPQLDTKDGRYDLQLEWRALAAALNAESDVERRARVADALAFRADRYRRFAGAEASEVALERNEGLAEYTGVVLGTSTAEQRKTMALHDLEVHLRDQSFVRSFAYATGPAYGLLLDMYRPTWHDELRKGEGPAQLLAQTMSISLSKAASVRDVARLALRYDGAALDKAETIRQQARDQLLAKYRGMFITGHTLVVPLKHPRVQFDPRNLVPMGERGTVYPTFQVSDDWGHLEVEQGCLLANDWSQVTVAAPSESGTNFAHGAGWKLDLAPGWKLSHGSKTGEVMVSKSDPGQSN